jgi:glycosyltransferase involved in cell wall biosynthesis
MVFLSKDGNVSRARVRWVVLTDTPNPWREKVYESVYRRLGKGFHVLYCARKPERRLWKFPLGSHPKTILGSLRLTRKNKERWINVGIVPFLLRNRPNSMIYFGFQPTVIVALALCRVLNVKLVVLSDTWEKRERGISWVQKAGRKLTYKLFADAFIGASEKTIAMFREYNKKAAGNAVFLSWLCGDNQYFAEWKEMNDKVDRAYDILFAGRIVDIKNPLFFAEVAVEVKRILGNCKALIIGEGEERLKNRMFNILKEAGVEYKFAGFIEHKNLPEYYARAKILLFPTSGDCWGVVINEAFASGVPVITTDKTAAVGEMVLHGKNGYVLPMNESLWAEKVCDLLEDTEKLGAFSQCAFETVQKFNFDNAARGIIEAINYLEGARKS